VPGAGARVQVRRGHTIVYDASSPQALRSLHIAGTLRFARDRDTHLDVGLIKIQPGDDASENGFDCGAHPTAVPGQPKPALEVGTPEQPIPPRHRATIRLVYLRGMDRQSCPALVCCGGRMDLHGAPLSRTWVKLGARAKAGDAQVKLAEVVTGWRVGDRVLVTATQRDPREMGTRRPGHRNRQVFTEERIIRAQGGTRLTLDRPLTHAHRGTGAYRGEVANLSRNVVVESADPAGVRGHTMYHRGSAGSISYAEFRHLGKEGVLGRYSLHYHLAGDTMRGSSVIGAAIWDSGNRWLTIHGTNYLVVRDCVGYQSVGHGFYLEDGTEVYNVLDRNLAVQAYGAKPLPEQALPFDQNDGAGFWWANSHNTFTRNVACENDRYGYRFEATKTSQFNPTLAVRQPDGRRRRVDIRTLPFVRFEDNETHSDGLYGFNLGEGVERAGPDTRHPFVVRGMKLWDIHYAFRPQSPALLVENMRIFRAHYGVYHPNYDHHVYRHLYIGEPGTEPFNRGHDDLSVQYGPLAVDGLTFDGVRSDYIPLIQISDDNPTGAAVSHFRNVKVLHRAKGSQRALVNLGGGPRPTPTTKKGVPIYLHDYYGPNRTAKVVSTRAKDLINDGSKYREEPPLTGDESRVAEVQGLRFPRLLDPVDDLPPATVITHVSRPAANRVVVRGTTADNGKVKRVLVNGKEARAVTANFAEWEVVLDGAAVRGEIKAYAEDAAGNVEKRPHVVRTTGSPATKDGLAAALRRLDGRVLTAGPAQATQLRQMLGDDVRARLRAANRRETEAWQKVKSRADWERFRDVRLQALRRSLGQFPPVPKDLKVHVTRTYKGKGYRVENLVFESRLGLLVTANLYAPDKPSRSMPGILICHSHHNPKTQGELQDMGSSWARFGCLVLVMDQLGHGERRAHPFQDAGSYPRPFRVGRQDYYFRYNTGMQLHVIGDSLIGWMVWDLSRGVDLLLARPGVDKDRIILLGAVAGGGDPAAVTASLDARICAVVPFNFGGPQPETAYPLPADAETAFNYAGNGSWESTRNLRLSARDGFLPWVIVGAAAPRRLIYAHEFAWDSGRDPVWQRLGKIYDFYHAPDRLASVHGRGRVTGRPPEATHCNNIGPVHRRGMYPALNKWFALGASPEKEYRPRLKAQELLSVTADSPVKLRPVYELAAALGEQRVRAARQQLAKLPPPKRLKQMQNDWAALLGDVEPKAAPTVTSEGSKKVGDFTVERLVLKVEPGIFVPALLLLPPHPPSGKMPVVVAFAQHGKQAFLKERAEGIAGLLQGGAAVCLPDLRGTGETRPGDSRDRTSAVTSLSATEWMLGQTLVGSRLRDLRSVLRYLRGRPDLDASRVALWGDSFAPANAGYQRIEVPLDADNLPAQAEPLGELLALLGALYEPDVKVIYARGGLAGYQALLHGYFCYVPHDAVVPGALTAGDLGDVAAMCAPRPVRLEGLVDGLNRKVESEALAQAFEPARKAYRGFTDRFIVQGEEAKGARVAAWLLARLKAE
jgi:cephalosporin-C deacetylase-like acetyl esterase